MGEVKQKNSFTSQYSLFIDSVFFEPHSKVYNYNQTWQNLLGC